jgi:hypothetical protein
MAHILPPQRWSSLATVAAASRSEKVLVVCSSRAVRCQYERAIPTLGGNLANVVFRVIGQPPKERT